MSSGPAACTDGHFVKATCVRGGEQTVDEKNFSVQLNAPPAWLEAHLRDALERRNNLLGQFFARWKVMAAVFIVSLIVGLYVIINIPKYYTATAVLVLDPRRNQIIEGLSPLASVQWDSVAVSNEVSMLQLPELAVALVRHLRLTSRPEYRRQGPGPLSASLSQVTRFLPAEQGRSDDPEVAERKELEFARNQLARNLQITNEPR